MFAGGVYMSAEMVRREPTPLEVVAQITSSNPNLTPAQLEVIERLYALKERMDKQEREAAFSDAMALLQAELPQIDKHGKIMVQGSLRSAYARIEDIDVQIRPFLSKHGFSFSWETQECPTPGEIRYSGTVLHREGHSVTKHIDLPIEDELSSSGKLMMTRVQKRGSTLSYAVRTLLRMHLNLVMREEDNDGQGNTALISAKDLETIKSMLAEKNADSGKFLAWLKVLTFEDIPAREVVRAMSFIRAKEKKAAE